MTEQPLTGFPLETALERMGGKTRAVLTVPPARKAPAEAEAQRVPYAVRVRDGEVVYALFRIPDPAKEPADR